MEAEAEEIKQRTLVLTEQQEAGAHETQKGAKEVAVMQDAVNLALDPSTSPSDALQQLQAQVMASEEHLASLQGEWCVSFSLFSFSALQGFSFRVRGPKTLRTKKMWRHMLPRSSACGSQRCSLL